jgi:hypothetical protein
MFSLMVLLASSSFSVGLHLCGGRVNAVAFLEQADGCGHKKMPPCHRQMMKDCCDDETVIHEGQGFKGDLAALELAAPSLTDVIHNTTLVIAEIIPDGPDFLSRFLYYDTPLRWSDRTIFLQVFLI